MAKETSSKSSEKGALEKAPEKKIEKAAETKAPEKAPEKAIEKPKEKPAEKPTLAKGHTHIVLADAITSRRGILCKDASCCARDFPGEEKQIEELVTKKLIKKG